MFFLRRPAWQQDNAAEQEELSGRRQAAFQHKHESAQAARDHKQACSANSKRVTSILNQWWADKANAVQEAVDRKEPNHEYQVLHELRQVFFHGRRPACKIRSNEGHFLRTRSERCARWL